jgi:heme exporter protein B
MKGWLIFKRDLSISAKRGGGVFATLGFCLIAFSCFGFSLGPDALQQYAAKVLVVAVLLSFLIALPGLFERDYEDGTLEQYLLQPSALEWLVLAKLCAFWCACAVPLLVLTPLLALMAGLNGDDTSGIVFALLLATPTLSAIGTLGAAFTLGVRKSGITQALIVLPLYVPPLIFTAGAAENANAFALLAAMALVSVPLSCLLTAGLLRLSAD